MTKPSRSPVPWGIYLSLLACVFMLSPARGQSLNDIGQLHLNARSYGMGQALFGLADDVNSLFTNPGGLGSLAGSSITFSQTKLLGEISYTSIGFASPTHWGTWGGSLLLSDSGAIPSTSLDGSGKVKLDGGESTTFRNNLFTLSYGRPLNEKFDIGVSLKYYSRGFVGGVNSSGSGINADVGILFRPSAEFSLGLATQNIIPAEWGGGVHYLSGYMEKPETAFVLGGGLHLVEDLIKIGFDLHQTRGAGEPLLINVGTELKLNPRLALRGGIEQSPTSERTDRKSNFTFGVGLARDQFSFDYAFRQFGDLSADLTHLFTITYAFSPLAKPVGEIEIPTAPLSSLTPSIVEKILSPNREQGNPNLVQEFLNGQKGVSFLDIEDPGVSNRPLVIQLSRIGLTDGYPDRTLKPSQEVALREFAKFSANLLGLRLTPPLSEEYATGATHWAILPVAILKEAGAIDSVEQGLKQDAVSGYEAQRMLAIIVEYKSPALVKSPELTQQGKAWLAHLQQEKLEVLDTARALTRDEAISILSSLRFPQGAPEGSVRHENE